MTNVFSKLPRLNEQGKDFEARASAPHDFARSMLAIGQVGQAVGSPTLPEKVLDTLNEVAATQPELASEMARFVVENAATEAEQQIALETGVKVARLIAAQMIIDGSTE